VSRIIVLLKRLQLQWMSFDPVSISHTPALSSQ
jgi:hypothetical protein